MAEHIGVATGSGQAARGSRLLDVLPGHRQGQDPAPQTRGPLPVSFSADTLPVKQGDKLSGKLWGVTGYTRQELRHNSG